MNSQIHLLIEPWNSANQKRDSVFHRIIHQGTWCCLVFNLNRSSFSAWLVNLYRQEFSSFSEMTHHLIRSHFKWWAFIFIKSVKFFEYLMNSSALNFKFHLQYWIWSSPISPHSHTLAADCSHLVFSFSYLYLLFLSIY